MKGITYIYFEDVPLESLAKRAEHLWPELTRERMDAYEEGYEAAKAPPPTQPQCPYPEDDPRHVPWWEGYGDSTEELIP